MTIRSAISIGPITQGMSVLMLGASLAALATSSIAAASAREQSRAEQHARRDITKARAALAHRQVAAAIAYAETAVSFEPNVAEYRMTLGQGYLKAGRFVSARDAFGDALTLDPSNGKAALQLALMQIGTGDWAGARTTLDAHAATIPVNDRGLAMALAGDPVGAVEVLGPAARSPDADAKTRQNLALSLALAGRWREAQSVVAVDLAPTDVAHRLLEWSTFSRPASASDQVSALLGVVPVADAGQPQALALNRVAKPATAVASAVVTAPVHPEPSEGAAQEPALATTQPEAAVAVAQLAPVAPTIAGVVFAPRREVVQAVPNYVPRTTGGRMLASRVKADRQSAPTKAQRSPAKGNFYVQLGAFETAAVAHDAWLRAGRRFAALAGHVPHGMGIAAGRNSYYRLSVGGFVRDDAVALCRTYRQRGGDCFVRTGAGDQIAAWARGREFASR